MHRSRIPPAPWSRSPDREQAVSELTITIPGRPPTPNARRHWRARAKDDAHWKSVASLAAAKVVPDDWTPLRRARLSIEFLVPDRRERDEDNLIASSKPLTDGLVEAGVLAGDGSKVIVDRQYTVTYVRGVAATVYRIEAVSEPAEAVLL